MSQISTGVNVIQVLPDLIDTVFQDKTVPLNTILESMIDPEDVGEWVNFPHVNLVLKSLQPKKSVLVSVDPDCQTATLLTDYSKYPIQKVKPRNKEQNMLLNSLMDEDISCVIVEGKAGSGKTLMALTAAFEYLFDRESPYNKIVLTRPMSTVGSSIGALPGDSIDKFKPYLGNYYSNMEFLFGEDGMDFVEELIERKKISIVPIALIGGISWHNTFVIADEIQSLSHNEMYALGTRPAEGTKLVLMGDSAQLYGKNRDVRTTGLHVLINHMALHESPDAAYIKLIKQERSDLADLFYTIFVDEEEEYDI